MNLDFDPKKNYYDILWLSEDASADDIKKAYRKLAMQYHPDRNKGDKAAEEKFKEVNEANEVLSNEQKKQQYDAFRKGWGAFGGFWGFGGGGFGGGTTVDFGDLGDLLGGFFGGWFGWGFWGGRRGPERGDDLLLQLTVSFEDAYHGTKKEVSYSRLVMAAGVESKTCPTCNGRGVVLQQTRTPLGMMQTQSACPTCHGTGVEYFKDGKKLEGAGMEKKQQTVNVTIPAWIKSWSKIRYPGMGNDGAFGGESGDLYVKVVIKQSDIRRRDDDNLLVDAEISIFEAVLGGELTVQHPDGPLTVKIPKGLQVGEYIRVSNKGFGEKKLLSSKGDLIVMPKIKIPKRLSKEEEKLRKELGEKGK